MEAGGATVRLRVIPLIARRRPDRGPGPVPRRHRAPPARAGAGRQGRDHPGDPPPGEEQPSDGGGAAAAAGRRLRRAGRAAREALREAERRIGSIALVHETLSRTAEDGVDFDEVADRVAAMVGDLGAQGDVDRQPRRELRAARAGGGHAAGPGAGGAGPERGGARARVGGGTGAGQRAPGARAAGAGGARPGDGPACLVRPGRGRGARAADRADARRGRARRPARRGGGRRGRHVCRGRRTPSR